ncbi:MAG TPA: PilZ domain-containing protein [Roseiflexaceae bacterium]|nr:PilZ domain-containing protein [Roseiflexaceae bacterium]
MMLVSLSVGAYGSFEDSMWHLEADRSSDADTQSRYIGQDRRKYQRIETPFPATVRGVDIGARRFEENTVLDNLSSRGLHLRLARPVQQGTKLFVLIRLSSASTNDPTGFIALHGVVLRVDARPGSVFRIAVRFTRHRFIHMVAAEQSQP